MKRNHQVFMALATAVLAPTTGFVVPTVSKKVFPNTQQTTTTTRFASDNADGSDELKISDDNLEQNNNKPLPKAGSKKEMLTFAIPALGIYLSNPLLSNIDNAFVGKTVGTVGLAALSPATVAVDQMLYLFSFLSRATTGIVARAYGSTDDMEANTKAARDAASAPLTISLISGIFLSIFYAVGTTKLLTLLNVNPALVGPARAYVLIRGAIAWSALSQSCALSTMMATRDAITPLKIIGLAAIVNVVGDAAMCVWPFRLGTSGAAAATAFATLFSSGFMLKSLKKKGILAEIRWPTKKELFGVLEYTGPLLAITITRLIGLINMQQRAMRMGVQQTAAYQLAFNLLTFFLLFGEPLSQVSQTQLPVLIERQDGPRVRATFKSAVVLGGIVSLAAGVVASSLLWFGTGMFSSDLEVQHLARSITPAFFGGVVSAIFAVAVDGAMLASRDFGFMLFQGSLTMLLQFKLLFSYCTTLSDVFHTWTIRLGSYAAFSLLRIALGHGPLGRAIRSPGTGVNGVSKVNGASAT